MSDADVRRPPPPGSPKDAQLESARVRPVGSHLTTQQGARVDHADDALSAGERGPTLPEDFHAREKIRGARLRAGAADAQRGMGR